MLSPFLFAFSAVLAVLIGTVHGTTPSSTRRCAAHHERANFSFDELYKLQVRFWDAFVSNDTTKATTVTSTLIAPDCLGRVDATRNLEGQELNTEYLFGLFANIENSNTTSLLGVPVSYDIIHFSANQDTAAAATVVFFETIFLGKVPVEIDTWFTWNKDGQLWQYDVTFRWFANLLDAMVSAAMPIVNATTTAEVVAYLTNTLATSICDVHQEHCTGDNQQYPDFATCYSTLTKQKRFGASYELGADTLLCRMVHQNMIPLRPAVHCPHVGPSGGGMCVDDTTYAEKVLQSYFTHAPMMPDGYENPNATIAAW